MEVVERIWIWILLCAIFGYSSEANQTLPECNRDGNSSRMEWRMEKQTTQLYLNSSNVACYSGEMCSNRTGNVELTSLISVIIQSGDEIQLFFDTENSSDNFTSHISIITKPEFTSKCDIENQKILMTSETKNLTLTNIILKSGELNIFVHLTEENTECDMIWRLQIKVQEHECRKNKDQTLCSGKGFCDNFSNTGSFSCRCCAGFVGKYCEERDGCYGNPCQHGGFCVDIAEGLVGTTFQCLCPHGYRGRSCEDEVSLCDRKPCQNNGTCTGNQTEYSCECPKGFAGPTCDTNVNECLSNPCVHGVCEDGYGGYKCYCLPGYGGDHCEFEYDECDSSPCINGGACEDLVAGYRCHCGPGYEGRRCQVKVDLCKPNPCPAPAQCVDRGNNYSCICHPGYNGPGCTQHYDPCYPNPCQNGGSCWPSLDSYFCSCNPGYTGDLCEEAMVAAQPLPRTLEDPGEPDERSGSFRHEQQQRDALDRWHSLYLMGTLLCLAASLVALVAVACHCRLNKTYQRFTRKISRSCSDLKQQKIPRQVLVESSWERF